MIKPSLYLYYMLRESYRIFYSFIATFRSNACLVHQNGQSDHRMLSMFKQHLVNTLGTVFLEINDLVMPGNY